MTNISYKTACTNVLPDDWNMMFETCGRHLEMNRNINLKCVHTVGLRYVSSDVELSDVMYVKWFFFKWSEVKWVTMKFLRTKVPCTLWWPFTENTWLYCDCLIWCVSCTVVVLTGFVMCGCFGNMFTCIYCVFVLFELCFCIVCAVFLYCLCCVSVLFVLCLCIVCAVFLYCLCCVSILFVLCFCIVCAVFLYCLCCVFVFFLLHILILICY